MRRLAVTRVLLRAKDIPPCDGQPCANVYRADEACVPTADTMAGDRNTPKAASEELPSRDWEAEIAEWQDKYLRLQAEFDNYPQAHAAGEDGAGRTGRERRRASRRCPASWPTIWIGRWRRWREERRPGGAARRRRGIDRAEVSRKRSSYVRREARSRRTGLELDTDHHEAVARFRCRRRRRRARSSMWYSPVIKMGDKVLRFAKVVVGE